MIFLSIIDFHWESHYGDLNKYNFSTFGMTTFNWELKKPAQPLEYLNKKAHLALTEWRK